MRDGLEIKEENSNNNALIGEMVNLTIKCTADDGIFNWKVTGAAYTDYNPTKDSAAPIVFDASQHTQNSISFFWSDIPDVMQVEVTFLCQNIECRKTEFISLVRPDVLQPSYITDLHNPKFDDYIRTDENGNQVTMVGMVLTGIYFTAKVALPASFTKPGTFTFVQVITNLDAQIAQGSIKVRQKFDYNALDTNFPYGNEWAADGTRQKDEDSPSYQYNPSTDIVNYSASFIMYIFYRPSSPGGKYVPLKGWSWYMSFCAQKGPSDTKPKVVTASPITDPGYKLNDVVVPPSWTTNVKSINPTRVDSIAPC